jgi:hypothetical protein
MSVQRPKIRFRRFTVTRVHFDTALPAQVRSGFKLASPFRIKRAARRDRQVRFIHLPALKYEGAGAHGKL